MSDYGFEPPKFPARSLRAVDPSLFSSCMAKHCPRTGAHDWVEVVADLGIVVQGKICDEHKAFLESLPAKNLIAEWTT